MQVPRPVTPDKKILSAALNAAAGLADVPKSDVRWSVGERIERPRSTLFPLSLRRGQDEILTAYYKALHVPAHQPLEEQKERTDRLRTQLRRTSHFQQRLASLIDQEAILVARVLAVDDQQLVVVSLAVLGQRLGHPGRWMLTAKRREATERHFWLMGRAARLIETASRSASPPPLERLHQSVERALSLASQQLPRRDLDAVASHLARLMDVLETETRHTVYAHGDLSFTNVLRTPQGIGLIDFGWIATFPGHDMAVLSHRLSYGAAAYTGWFRDLRERALEGYAPPSPAVSTYWQIYAWRKRLALVDAPRVSRLSHLLANRRAYRETMRELERIVPR